MARYEVTAPDGQRYEINAPEGATAEQALEFFKQNWRPKGPRTADTKPTAKDLEIVGYKGPADAGNTFVEGIGKGMVDTVRGVRQLLPDSMGGLNYSDIAETRRLDSPLMQTTGGKVGNVTGQVAASLPAAFIPGAATIKGAAAIGAGLGFLQPSASAGETVKNTGIGAAAGPASVLVGRAAGATYNAGKAVIEPLLQGGQERIAARTIQSFAGGPKAVEQVISDIERGGAKAFTPGVVRTLAESTDNAGISQLQRTLENNPELIKQFGDIAKNNRAAVEEAINSMTDKGQKAFFEAMRDTTAQQMYKKAWSAGFNEKQLAKYAPNIEELMGRPSMKSAVETAKRIAAEEGEQLTEVGSMKGLHYVKKALDDALDSAAQTGVGNIQKRAIAGTRDQLIAIMDKVSKGGAYPKARAEYEAMSKPINQIDVAQMLRDKLIPALADYGANTRLTANNFAQGLRSGDQIAQQATGFKGATLQSVMEPAQISKLEGIAKDLGNAAAAAERGRAKGSPTAQNLASQNFLRQFLGPLGLPEGVVEKAVGSSLMQSATRPIQFTAKIGEERVMGLLGQAMADPQKARSLLLALNQPKPVARGMIGNILMDTASGAGLTAKAVGQPLPVGTLGLLGAYSPEQ